MYKVFAAAVLAFIPAILIIALYEAFGLSFQGDMNRTIAAIYAASFVASFIVVHLLTRKVETNDN